MDEHYDFPTASGWQFMYCHNRQLKQIGGFMLHTVMEERLKSKPEMQISALVPEHIAQFEVTNTAHPTRWRMIRTTDGGEKQELILRVQGILTLKDLPPIQERRKKRPEDAKFMRQSVQLTGLDTSMFNTAVHNIRTLYAEFSRHFQAGDLHVWNPDTFTTHAALNIYNRYFYTTKDCPNQAAIALGDTIDPNHILAAMGLASGLIHTGDNQVEYFKFTSDRKISPTNPLTFRIGDIVEVNFSIVVIPVKKSKFQMMLVLRGLALLDSSLTTLAHTKRIAKVSSSSHQQVSGLVLKRKTCYDEDEEREVQQVRKAVMDMSV